MYRNTLIGLTAAVALLGLCPAGSQAQTLYDAATPYQTAHGSASSYRTFNMGTDVYRLAKAARVQVMVYDVDMSGDGTPDNVMLSWNHSGNQGALKLSSTNPHNLADPDVVLTYEGSSLFAKVVFLQQNPSTGKWRTRYQVFKWNGSSFVPFHTPVDLGQTVNSVGELRDHASPNIDANSSGYTAIVWEESIIEKSHVVVTSASYSMAYDVDVRYGFGYATVLHMGDTPNISQLPQCSRGAIISGPVRFLDQSLSPDVAVGSGSDNYISFVYNRAYVDFKTHQQVSLLTVRQTQFQGTCNGDLQAEFVEVDRGEWGIGLGAPRIAASPDPNRPLDVEVVGNWAGGECVVNRGPVSYWGISNVGKSNGAFRANVSPVTPDVDRERYSGEAVVSYSGDKADSHYTVAWTGQNYPNIGEGQDVWARQMEAGNIVHEGISRVHTDPKGTQRVPAIAGRYLYGQTQYAYANENGGNEIRYTLTWNTAGAGALRQAGSQPGAGGLEAAPDMELRAFPNPASQALSFEFWIEPREQAQAIEIVDLMGRRLDRIALDAQATGRQQVRWANAKQLPAGTYTARLVTSQRTKSVRVVKAAE
ncbi:T9SS type A sorting domain-containing protein [Hymenobacter sp. B81]|uniref:T9SS type A sorting domain-containing protein n=1 Tax=Hymenobacter sp. B81 TaxID=3344878 RepID=UPI0037DC55CC